MALSQLSRSIRGSAVLVTGAASGIGRATAFVFADEGARLVISDRNAEELEKVRTAIAEAGGDVVALTADLADRDAVTGLVETAVSELGGLDVLVNNAGLAILAGVDGDNYSDSWDISMAVMAQAQAWAARAALPALRQSANPRIINLASTETLECLSGLLESTVGSVVLMERG